MFHQAAPCPPMEDRLAKLDEAVEAGTDVDVGGAKPERPAYCIP